VVDTYRKAEHLKSKVDGQWRPVELDQFPPVEDNRLRALASAGRRNSPPGGRWPTWPRSPPAR
jgi:hypothetical protein